MKFCPECGAKLDAKASAKLDAKDGAKPSATETFERVFDSRSSTNRQRHDYKDPWFQAFWKEYPRAIAKLAAFKAFQNAIKRGANPQSIIDATKLFSAVCRRTHIEQRYIPYPASWLNDGRYDDEIEAMADVKPVEPLDFEAAQRARMAEEDRELERLRDDG